MGNLRINLRTIFLSATVSILIFYSLITLISSDIRGVEANSGEELTVEDDMMKDDFHREQMYQDMMDRDMMGRGMMGRDDFMGKDEMNEVVLEDGRKFKLFEKKRLQHKKASTFCKNREGKLVRAMNADEMKRLQLLLMKARMVGDQIWIGADKKEWKKHSSKMMGMNRPNLPPDIMAYGGGGPTEMCPALSTSTRSLTPAPCYNQLPFICEFEPGKGKKKKKSPKAGNKTKDEKKKKKPMNIIKDEMRRKRAVVKVDEMTTSMADEENEDNENLNTTSTGTSTMAFDDGLGPTPPLTSTNNPDEDFIHAHKIGFLPHIVADMVWSGQNSTMDYTMVSTETSTMNARDGHGQIQRVAPNKRLATPDVHLKFSSKLDLQSDSPVDDPDQQMLDLINEQSLGILEDGNTTEEVNMKNGSHSSIIEETVVLAMATATPSRLGIETRKSEQMGQEQMAFVTDTTTNVQTEILSSQPPMMTTTAASRDLERGPRSFSQSTNQMNLVTSTSTQASSEANSIMSEMLAEMTGSEIPEMPVSSSMKMSPTTPESVERSTTTIINAMTSDLSSKSSPDLEIMSTSENSMTDESTNRPDTSTIVLNSKDSVVDLLVTTGRMFTTTPAPVWTSTTEAAMQIKTTSDSTTMKTTSQSMTATAPKTTIDPMTQPMPTESPSSPNVQDQGTSAKPESAKNISADHGKLIPSVNVTTTMKPRINSTHKENTNGSLNSLLHPQSPTPTKVMGTGGTSTSSPSPLLTPRVIKPPMVSARGSKRSMGSPSTTHSTGEYPTMKSSMPTLLQPQI